MNVYIGIMVFFGDYFYCFVVGINVVVWYGNVWGWFKCDRGNDILFCWDICKYIVCVIWCKIIRS